jgi:hypothetical protein
MLDTLERRHGTDNIEESGPPRRLVERITAAWTRLGSHQPGSNKVLDHLVQIPPWYLSDFGELIRRRGPIRRSCKPIGNPESVFSGFRQHRRATS